MLNEFKQYLLGIGKSENTALNYCDKVKLYFKWCLDSFGSEPQQLYRANVLDYISYMKTITEIDGAVGMNSGIFNNPFIIGGRYKKKWFRYYLSISFQFHHTQMDGAHAGIFLKNLQNEINLLK